MLKTSPIPQYEKDHHYYEAYNIENAYNNTLRKNKIKLLVIFKCIFLKYIHIHVGKRQNVIH